MPNWDARQYLKFSAERTQPASDLLHQVNLASVNNIVDLGCGPGNSTRLLKQQWPDAHIIGIDNSSDMLKTAMQDNPDLQWEFADINSWSSLTKYDVIFANACLQWLPNHTDLIPRLIQQLAPHGALAVQMPNNQNAPNHALIRQIADDPRWASRLKEARTVNRVQSLDVYYQILAPHITNITLWETTYIHVMPNVEAILEWMRGSGLRPYLERLEPAEQTDFLRQYLILLQNAYPLQQDGKLLFSFSRIFFIAYL